ncbi:MAG: hypothetical protein HQ559_07165 [Lentisphaerae bacterium]|nr:hypothetical protein [Lentisphaerota bacterium]
MADKKPGKEKRYSADKLLSVFSRTRLTQYVLWSLGLHVFVISLTSYVFLRDRMFPEAARQRELEERERQSLEQKDSAGMRLGKAYVDKAKADYQARVEAARAASATNAAGTNATADVSATNATLTAVQAFEEWVRANNVNTNLPSVQQVLKDTPPDKWNTPVIREMISMPTADEIPTEPESDPDLGISLDDTNP